MNDYIEDLLSLSPLLLNLNHNDNKYDNNYDINLNRLNKIKIIKNGDNYDIIDEYYIENDDNNANESILNDSDIRYERFVNDIMKMSMIILMNMLSNIEDNNNNNTNTIDRLNEIVNNNINSISFDGIKMLLLLSKMMTLSITIILQYYHNHRYNSDNNNNNMNTNIIKGTEIIIKILLNCLYITSSILLLSSPLSTPRSEYMPIIVELENLIIILLSIDSITLIEPSSFLILSQHEIIHSMKNNTNDKTLNNSNSNDNDNNNNSSNNNDNNNDQLINRISLMSSLLNDNIFKSSKISIRRILNDKHNNNNNNNNTIANINYINPDTNDIANNILLKLKEISIIKNSNKKVNDNNDYDVTYSCISMARLLNLLPSNEIIDTIIATSMLIILKDRKEIIRSNFLQSAGLISGIKNI